MTTLEKINSQLEKLDATGQKLDAQYNKVETQLFTALRKTFEKHFGHCLHPEDFITAWSSYASIKRQINEKTLEVAQINYYTKYNHDTGKTEVPGLAISNYGTSTGTDNTNAQYELERNITIGKISAELLENHDTILQDYHATVKPFHAKIKAINIKDAKLRKQKEELEEQQYQLHYEQFVTDLRTGIVFDDIVALEKNSYDSAITHITGLKLESETDKTMTLIITQAYPEYDNNHQELPDKRIITNTERIYKHKIEEFYNKLSTPYTV